MMVKKTGGRVPVKQIMKSCKIGYCNPTCKGTIFQNGKNFPKNVKAPTPMMLSIMKGMRNGMFKNKTSVLKNSFYEKLKKKNVACAKKRGATSGCTLLFLR
jgi:hypothetical protein